jgi:hypothetical protein
MESGKKETALDLELARRLQLALTANEEALFRVVVDPSMEVLKAVMKNPALNESHLLALLNRRDLSEDFLNVLHRHGLVEASHRIKLAMVRNPNIPGSVALSLMPHIHLFELVDLLSLAGIGPDQKYAAERAIIQRLPGTPLGNKLTLARRGTAAVIEAILKEGDSRVVDTCLANPRLTQGAVYQFLTGATASAETISSVARHERWKAIPSIRSAILKNPQTPPVWFTLFLPQLQGHEVRELSASRRLAASQKKLVEQELKRRGIK